MKINFFIGNAIGIFFVISAFILNFAGSLQGGAVVAKGITAYFILIWSAQFIMRFYKKNYSNNWK